MKLKLFETMQLKFEKPDWSRNPTLGLIDTILELHPELLKMVEPDILSVSKVSNFGRQDTPSIEQIFRAALYK